MYTTKRILAVLMAVIMVFGMVSVSFAEEVTETIGVSLSASKTAEDNDVTCKTNNSFKLYFGADKFALGEKALNTYEFTVWYDKTYVTLNAENVADVSGKNGRLLLGDTATKTVDEVEYAGQTFTYASFEKGFGEAADEKFNALLEIPFKAVKKGDAKIFIESEGITLLPVADEADFTAKLDAAVAKGEIKVTIESSGGTSYSGTAGIVAVKRTVIFNVDGVKTSVVVNDGAKVAKPADPVKEGYTFAGWYKEKNFKTLYDFNEDVVDSIELFAKFDKIEEPVVVVPALPFTDVKEADWFYEGVKYVFEKNMVKGVTETAYAPDNTLTRATLVTLLYRMENEPQAGENAFTDVAGGAWYENAVAWAAANEIVLGMGEGIFAPDVNITREQIAVILYKYTKFKGGDVSKTADLTAFTDAADVSDWAKDALSWAVAEGLIQGMGENTVAPTATANRAQIATILMRYMS